MGALLAASACRAPPAGVRIAQVEGRPVAYRVIGSGRPVLVMISGLGDGMGSFRDVAPDLARHATVILYDRAGYGGSGAAYGVRDAAAADRELSGMLARTGAPGPYVIVGHSLGGLYAEHFAARHPDAVAGLVLEESRPADFTRRCEAAAAGPCSPPGVLVRFMPSGAQAEVAALGMTTAEVSATTPLQGKPVLVISRAARAKPKAFDRLWLQAQDDLAARYRGARHVVSPSGGHYVHHDQHAWFVSTVDSFAAGPEIGG